MGERMAPHRWRGRQRPREGLRRSATGRGPSLDGATEVGSYLAVFTLQRKVAGLHAVGGCGWASG
eukprot:4059014-Pyramimonas_sp.AAC.1